MSHGEDVKFFDKVLKIVQIGLIVSKIGLKAVKLTISMLIIEMSSKFAKNIQLGQKSPDLH